MGKFGINQVILKNKRDRAYIVSLRDPARIEGMITSMRLTEDLHRRFQKEYPEPTTRRERRKAKKREKSFLHTKTINIDPVKFRRFIAVFFTLAFIGAVVSWILMAGKAIKPLDYFSISAWERQYVADPGGSGGMYDWQDGPMANPEALVAKQAADEPGFFSYCMLKLKDNSIVPLGINSLGFKLQAHGSGGISVEIEIWDAAKMQPGEAVKIYIPSNQNSAIDIKDGKSASVSAAINHRFESYNVGSYIKIKIRFADPTISSLALFKLSVTKS